MPFSFIDIEKKKSFRIVFLFLSLVLFYFIGALLVYASVGTGLIKQIFAPAYLTNQEYFSLSFPSLKSSLNILALAFIIALFHWIYSTVNMIPRILSLLRAKPLDPQDLYHNLFKNIVEEVSVATGGKKIDCCVINSHYLNAFALQDFNGRSVIGITEGLLIKLTRRQLEAVVAHEASHIVWQDCLISTVCCSMSAIYAALFKKTLDAYRTSRARFVHIYLFMAIAFMRLITLILNCWISREKEYRADATCVRLTRDPLSLAEALFIIARNWRGFNLLAEELSPIFILNPSYKKLDEQNGIFADLFSTHPPLKRRLYVLLKMGHSTFEMLTSTAKERKPIQETITISSPENKKSWYGNNEGTWQGPFDLASMAQLNWLRPDTWIKKEGESQVKPAYEHQEMNNIFKSVKTNYGDFSCPICHQGLEKIYYEGATIWQCFFCDGKLVKKDAFPRIIVRKEMQFSEEVKKMASLIRKSFLWKPKNKSGRKTSSLLMCPSCNNQMNRYPHSGIYPLYIEIDECYPCNILWFDKNELEIIQYILELGVTSEI